MINEYTENAKTEIAEWEGQGPGYLAQVGDWILWPVQKAAEAVIPAGAQEQVGKALVGCLSVLSSASEWTFNTVEVHDRVKKYLDDCGDELNAADDAAKHYWNFHIGYAASEGFTSGFIGFPGLIVDIPALFTLSLRLIQQVGTCYGYDVTQDEEKEYVMQILRTGSTGDIKAKVEFLVALKQVEQILLKVTWKKMNEALAKKEIGRLALLAGIKQFAKSLGIQITKRKALQIVPVIGAIVGASFNATFVNDVGRAAYMSYRRRKIAEIGGS